MPERRRADPFEFLEAAPQSVPFRAGGPCRFGGGVGSEVDRSRHVIDVARREPSGTVEQFLGEDFRRGFDIDPAAGDRSPRPFDVGCRIGGHDEVDVAVCHDDLHAICLLEVAGGKFRRSIVQPRAQNRNPLRVVAEKVDVLAEAMLELEHQNRAATERERRGPKATLFRVLEQLYALAMIASQLSGVRPCVLIVECARGLKNRQGL